MSPVGVLRARSREIDLPALSQKVFDLHGHQAAGRPGEEAMHANDWRLARSDLTTVDVLRSQSLQDFLFLARSRIAEPFGGVCLKQLEGSPQQDILAPPPAGECGGVVTAKTGQG